LLKSTTAMTPATPASRTIERRLVISRIYASASAWIRIM
jgi:hypothetical protein